MSPGTQIGIFAPPVIGALVFLLCCGSEVLNGRDLPKEKIQFLCWLSLGVTVVGYGLAWNREINAFLSR